MWVRKLAKDYGTCQLAEGREIKKRYQLLVEDVVTSGGQVLQSAEELRRRGAIVEHALCVIDREQGGAAALANTGIRLHALFDKSYLLHHAGS